MSQQPTRQQLIESNIQKLVQALCSSSPRDNLKAIDYLRTHADLVPRVIQGLQYLKRDKEVSYLQQEFGGGIPQLNLQQETRMQSSTSFPPEYVEQAQSSSRPQGGPKPSTLLSSLGASNGFPDDGPHTITAVPHMGGQSNNNQGQELMSSTPHSLMGNTPASGLLSVYTPASSDPAISAIKSEIFSPPIPPPPGAKPPPATYDPEKRKLIQQQLVLLLHAHRCQQREREQQTHGGFRPCALPHCRTMKNVLNHMTECRAGRYCQFPHCASSRQILYHWENCNQQECPVCLPLKTTTRNPNVGPSLSGPNSIFGPEPATLSPHLVPTGTGIPQAPPGGGALEPSPTLPPNHVRTWRAEVSSDLRNHLIKKLVVAIYPVPNPHNMHDSRVASLFQYAVKTEKMIFENASSREDYYQKLANKIYRVRKELDEKRKDTDVNKSKESTYRCQIRT